MTQRFHFPRPITRRSMRLAGAVVLLATLGAGANASTPKPYPPPAQPSATSLNVRAEQQLRFGTMVVIDSGARTVGASGEVTNDNVLPMGYAGVGPAQFTISYDRGTEDGHPINVVVQITLANLPPVTQGAITGGLGNFDTDLPGAAHIEPGRPITTTIAGCVSRVCSVTFHVGARLSITRGGGDTPNGGAFSISPPITATVLAVTG